MAYIRSWPITCIGLLTAACLSIVATATGSAVYALNICRGAALAVFDLVARYTRDWLENYRAPVIALRKLSPSLFGPEGKLAVYERRRFERWPGALPRPC